MNRSAALSRRWVAIATVTAIAALSTASTAHAACNVIPSGGRSFASTLGDVTAPYARPGDTITILRDVPAFAQNGSENAVSVEFQPSVGAATLIDDVPAFSPAPGTSCTPDQCVASRCTCLRFRMPDTDALFGQRADGKTLTGPMAIRVETGGQTVAIIDALRLPGTTTRDDLFPHFVALPRANPIEAVIGQTGSVLATSDASGNLLVPLDFRAFAPEPDPALDKVVPTQFLEAEVPGLEALAASALVESFTPEGRRLPPLLKQVGPTSLLGTVDAPASVLRIDRGVALFGLQGQLGPGPISIGGVTARADARKRGDPSSIRLGSRFVVFENRECGKGDMPEYCRDVNGDGDMRDYFLSAFDATVAGSPTIVVDQLDGGSFPGYPENFPRPTIYGFAASDKLVAFRIPEVSIPDAFSGDINGNGSAGDIIRSGLFDLRAGTRVTTATGSPRMEVDDGIAAFAWPLNGGAGPDRLAFYDADASPPGSFVIGTDAFPFLLLNRSVVPDTRKPFGGVSQEGSFPLDLSVHSRRIAFFIPEVAQGADVDGNGTLDQALALADLDAGTLDYVSETFSQTVRLSGRWLTTPVVHRAPSFTSVAIGLYDVSNVYLPPKLLCDRPFGYANLPWTPFSDGLIPCLQDERGALIGGVTHPLDLNGDGDSTDQFVLATYLPDAPGAPIERNLGLALSSPFDAQISGDTLVVGVQERAQNADLDGDGAIGGGPTFVGLEPAIVHSFNGVSGKLENFRQRALASTRLTIDFIDRGLTLLSNVDEKPLRTFMRDLDRDGHFEDFVPASDAQPAHLADNCPLVHNPFQEDRDGNGIGDACDPATATLLVDDFERKKLPRWAIRVPDGKNPKVACTSPIEGLCSLQVSAILGASAYLEDRTPTAERLYRVRLSLDPSQLVLTSGKPIKLVSALGGTGVVSVEIELRVKRSKFQVRAAARRDGGGTTYTSWVKIAPAATEIELEWLGATLPGRSDGAMRLWTSGVLRSTVVGIDNDTRRVEAVRLGLIDPVRSTTSGKILIDAFASYRTARPVD